MRGIRCGRSEESRAHKRTVSSRTGAGKCSLTKIGAALARLIARGEGGQPRRCGTA
jgi:hypothetical protein